MVGMLPKLIEPGWWADELNGSGSKHLEAENGFQGKEIPTLTNSRGSGSTPTLTPKIVRN